MRLEQALNLVAEVTPEQFEDLRRNIDADWIEQALHATGTATRPRLEVADAVEVAPSPVGGLSESWPGHATRERTGVYSPGRS
jgi:hypothetical protein